MFFIINIFTAKIFRIILNGKTLLYSGLSWIFWLRSDGLRIASKVMPRTFWSTTQSNNAQVGKMLDNISDCVKKTFLYFTALFYFSSILTWISIQLINIRAYFFTINTYQSDLNGVIKKAHLTKTYLRSACM